MECFLSGCCDMGSGFGFGAVCDEGSKLPATHKARSGADQACRREVPDHAISGRVPVRSITSA